jgi:hypothetical protein
MIRATDLQKLGRFGLLGALGCLAGWLIGEPVLALALPDAAAGGAPSLVSKPAPPPPSAEFDARLKERNAQTGDIQISLIWDNRHDLDLHCLPPAPEEEIWFQRRGPSRSGGTLDVDTNAGCERNVSDRAVENIFWPVGKAPQGEYIVYVDFYTTCPKDVRTAPGGGDVECDYRLSVLAEGRREEVKGRARYDLNDQTRRKVEVYRFRLGPKLRVYAPEKVALAADGTGRIPFEVERLSTGGPVTVTAEGLPAGVAAKPVELAAGATRGELDLTGAKTGDGDTFKLVATGENLRGETTGAIEYTAKSGWSWRLILVLGVWTALLAAGLTVALLAGQNHYLKRPLYSDAMPVAVGGAALAGFASGAIGQTLLFLFAYAGLAGLGFVAGWALLGLLVGYGVSHFIPNLDRTRATVAGLVGGVVAAVAFLVVSLAADWLGRVVGAAMLGLCIGLMVALVEAAFRRAWLEIRLGAREQITVNLGPEPVSIGSDARACTVFARGAPHLALRYWVRNGAVVCHDHTQVQEQTVAEGDTRTAGTVEVTVRTGGAPVPQPVPLTPSAPAPAPTPARAPAPEPEPVLSAVASAPAPEPAAVVTVPKPAPPRPAAAPKPPAPSIPTAPSAASDTCPVCNRKAANRYCLVCDRKF